MNSDPRFLRSQKRLHEAILELAGELSVDKISVTAIAERANVHRSTVYEHADSIPALLRQAINSELDSLYNRFGIGSGANRATLASSCAVVLEHLESRESLFARMNGPDGAEIRDILRTHFMGSLSRMLDLGHIDFPETTSKISTENMRRFTVYAIADMHVGLYAATLQMPKPRLPEVLVEIIELTSPSWWNWELPS